MITEQYTFALSPVPFIVENIKHKTALNLHISCYDSVDNTLVYERIIKHYANTDNIAKVNLSPIIREAFKINYIQGSEYEYSNGINHRWKKNNLKINLSYEYVNTNNLRIIDSVEFLTCFGKIPNGNMSTILFYDLKPQALIKNPQKRFLTGNTKIKIYKNVPFLLAYFSTLTPSINVEFFSYSEGVLTTYTIDGSGAILPDVNSCDRGYFEIEAFDRKRYLYDVIDVDLEKLKSEKNVYLRWKNSIGGLSYYLFGCNKYSEKIDETFFDINIKSNIIDSDFRDFEVLDKDSRKQLTCGANDIETDCLPDIVDLFTSEYVDFYSVGLDWIPVRISGTPNIDPNNKIHSVDFNVIFSK